MGHEEQKLPSESGTVASPVLHACLLILEQLRRRRQGGDAAAGADSADAVVPGGEGREVRQPREQVAPHKTPLGQEEREEEGGAGRRRKADQCDLFAWTIGPSYYLEKIQV